MNLFDQLVTDAIINQPHLSTLRSVVEKELLHHDILRVLSQNDFLKSLTFMGGTCLRACYGGIRLSEDLDFTGGRHFSRKDLSAMGEVLVDSLMTKYGLEVIVSEPIKDKKNVDTWKIKVEIQPQKRNLPAQRINIDICRIPSYEKQPMLLLNPYSIDMGTSGLVIQVESREEIYTDKLLAFALRPNRLKYRDLWDIAWLHQQGLKPNLTLIPNKLNDYCTPPTVFLDQYIERQKQLVKDHHLALEFKKEMQRFLPPAYFTQSLEENNLWAFIVYLINDVGKELHKIFNAFKKL